MACSFLWKAGMYRCRGGISGFLQPVEEVLAGTQFQHEKQPFPGVQSLVQGDDILVDRQGEMDGGFEQLRLHLLFGKILLG